LAQPPDIGYVRRMPVRTLRLALMAVLAAAAVAVGVGAGVAPADGGRASATPKITKSGVGGVKLGRRFRRLRAAGLVGRLRHGCELGGPNTRFARLRAPLKGSVDFTLTQPRRVTNISVTGGAKARGVGIGSTIAQIKAAFPKAKVDHSTEQVFGITLVKVPKNGGGRLQFSVPTATGKADVVGIPFIAFCE
jgi:hypothetical protein